LTQSFIPAEDFQGRNTITHHLHNTQHTNAMTTDHKKHPAVAFLDYTLSF